MKTLIAIITILIIILPMAGCDNYVAEEVAQKPDPKENQTRLAVVSRQVFRDSRGYNRDILMLRDTMTGVEYLAVMGAGVAEIRIRSNGKTSTTVEE